MIANSYADFHLRLNLPSFPAPAFLLPVFPRLLISLTYKQHFGYSTVNKKSKYLYFRYLETFTLDLIASLGFEDIS